MLKLLVLSLFCIQHTFSLYEDQIGKFDWKQSFLGEIEFSYIDSRQNVKRIYVASKENVVAALSMNTGNILWRQVLEKNEQGNIVYFHSDGITIVTVSQNKLVRVWNPNEGSLLTEWTFPLDFRSVQFMVDGGNFYAVELSPQNQLISVHTYKLGAGTVNDVVKKVPASWLNENSQCLTSQNYLACLNKGVLKVLAPAEGQPQVLEHILVSKDPSPLVAVSSAPGIPSFKVGRTVVTVNQKKLFITESTCASVHVDQDTSNKILLICVNGVSKTSLDVEIYCSEKISSNSLTLKTQIAFSNILIKSCFCKGSVPSCFCLISTKDHTALFVSTQGKVVWMREEALANIVATEFVDLPVSDVDAAIEKEFDNQESGYLDMFMRRLVSQIYQLQTMLSLDSPSSKNSASLVRDKFGLHKIILAVSSTGKVFAIDNLSGKLIWALYIPNITPYSINNKLFTPIFVQRSTRHIPHPAQVSLLFKDSITSEGVLFILDPISGLPIDSETGLKLGYQVSLSFLLPGVNKNYLRGILLLDSNNKVHLEPPTSPIPKSYFLYKVESKTGVLTGYLLQEDLKLSKTWELNLGQPVVNVASKNPIEKVHSQGRVLHDRSVLYKYLNPNLITVATFSHDNVYSVYLVDVVSGTIVDSIVHKRTIGPFFMVHSENWLVYVYYNEKTRRNEVTTVEMYEGNIQSNSTAFSSFSKPFFKPLLDKQSYILPVSRIDAIKETITEKGITSKHILIALGTGGILEMPWMFLDPRRPTTVTPEMREEGQVVVEYAPELPLLSEGIINYNQTLYRIKDIHTAPSGLESTCFVFAYGLDLFYTRVAPSKTFDMLKEDFDYVLICIVLAALIVGAIVSKKLSSRKILKQAWK